jgi:hypothetical protein
VVEFFTKEGCIRSRKHDMKNILTLKQAKASQFEKHLIFATCTYVVGISITKSQFGYFWNGKSWYIFGHLE